VVILDGTARALPHPDRLLAEKVAEQYRAKYAGRGYAPQADQWDEGGLYEFRPHKALAWTEFNTDPTRFEWES
jgi:hypothetical protein